jgi:hypothetical protein
MFILWQLCLLMDQNEMSNLYRGPSIDASYQFSYHLAKWFQRKICFRNQTIRNLSRKHLWKFFYRDYSFRPHPLTNMATTGDSCFWLTDFKNSSPLKLFGQMYRNLVENISKRFQRRFLEIVQLETRIACGDHVC